MFQKISILIFIFLIIIPSSYAKNPYITTLDNGLTVIIEEDNSVPLVAVDIWVNAGSAYETRENNGLSHFIEHLVFASTEKRKAGEMDIEMESLGAVLNAYTSKDWAHFSSTIRSIYLDNALEVFFDALTTAKFIPEELEIEKKIILEEIARKKLTPKTIVKDLLSEYIYGNHPYSLPIEGIDETVKKLKSEQALEHYKKLYVPNNMAVVLVGDIDTKKAIESIQNTFGQMPKSDDKLPQIPSVEKITDKKRLDINQKLPSFHLAIGYIAPKADNFRDICAMDVIVSHFGYGRVNWLSDHLITSKLSKSALADFLTQMENAMFSIIVETDKNNSDTIEKHIFSKMEELASFGIMDSYLEIAKRTLLGKFSAQNETFSGRAVTYGFYNTISSTQFADDYMSCIRSINNEDIKRVAKEYLQENHSVVLRVCPE
ncbi:MAG: pitrilysin family protein [Armatimonadota bacterium]